MTLAILVAGLGFGDEGKGATVDFLTRLHGAHTVVRYNGGAQAGHNVVTSDGRHHTFAQFGSGTFAGARTHLSRYMLVNPIFLLSEGKHLQSIGEKDVFNRLTVEEGALITNPFQVSANRIREMARDGARHGSCGMGIGETMADSLAIPEPQQITIKDLRSPQILRSLLERSRMRKLIEVVTLHTASCPIRSLKWTISFTDRCTSCSCSFAKEWEVLTDPGVVDLAMERFAEFADLVKIVPSDYLPYEIMDGGTTIFEGAQGLLLDQDYGFHPYTTWTDITFRNAYDLLGLQERDIPTQRGQAWDVTTGAFYGQVRRVGALRTYHTRHGSGPFPTEDRGLKPDPREHNCKNPWQQGFRIGHFDLCLARYALEAIGGVDELAISHLDHIQNEQKICVEHSYPPEANFVLDASKAWGERIHLCVREWQTGLFMKAIPRYRTLNYSPEGFATEIAKLLGVKIGSVSFGPQAEDRSSR